MKCSICESTIEDTKINGFAFILQEYSPVQVLNEQFYICKECYLEFKKLLKGDK